MIPKTPQRQYKKGTAPQEHVMPHSMDIREGGSPSNRRSRDSRALGTDMQARPGLSGALSRSPIKYSSKRGK